MLINNSGAAEFHIPPKVNAISTIDLHIGAEHNRTAKAWAQASGYEYLTATNFKEFEENLQKFVSAECEYPVFFEVFTDMKKDGETCLSIYRNIEEQIKMILTEV